MCAVKCETFERCEKNIFDDEKIFTLIRTIESGFSLAHHPWKIKEEMSMCEISNYPWVFPWQRPGRGDNQTSLTTRRETGDNLPDNVPYQIRPGVVPWLPSSPVISTDPSFSDSLFLSSSFLVARFACISFFFYKLGHILILLHPLWNCTNSLQIVH